MFVAFVFDRNDNGKMSSAALLAVLSLVLGGFAGCGGSEHPNAAGNSLEPSGDDDDNDNDNDDASPADDDTGDPILPTAGFLARQAQFIKDCSTVAAPPSTDIRGIVCRLAAKAASIDPSGIDNTCTEMNSRSGSVGFDMTFLMRILYQFRDSPRITPDLLTEMEDAVLNGKYWLSEPGVDQLSWWSENLQAEYHTSELLAGQLFKDLVFSNSGMTGAQHIAHVLPMLHQWLDYRARFGWSEWHSNVYFNEEIAALVNLADFAEDETVSLKAKMLLDVLAFDFANNYYQGIYATTHGRTYESHVLGGSTDSTTEAAWLMDNLGNHSPTTNDAGVALATSPGYWPPAILEHVAADALDNHEARERDGIMVADGPEYGIGYTASNDILFWWGMTAYVASDVIMGSFQFVQDNNLWNGDFWDSFKFLRFLVGNPLLKTVAQLYDPIFRGPALETVNTYTWRTPDYQLSGAQDHSKGMWGAQDFIWQATIDEQAYVFTTYPGGLQGDYMAGPWTGGWQPRAALHENVGIIQYQRRSFPLLDKIVFVEYTHAYFPHDEFDEFTQTGNWTFGRKGDSYVALYSQNPTVWSTENNYELIADGAANVWIVELGSATENGSFAEFMAGINAAAVTIGDDVQYVSPSQGPMAVSWDGPFTVAGQTIDLGPYPRWDNKYAQQEFGTTTTEIQFAGERLELDFAAPSRRYWAS